MERGKRAAKRVLSFLLALCMAVMLMPVVPMKAEAAENGITRRIAELRNIYPDGKYWHRGNDGVNNVRDYGCGNDWKNKCSFYDGGWQCWAFASNIFKEIFGQAPNSGGGGWKGYNSADVRVGDYVRFTVPGNETYGHSFLVIAKDGDNVTVVEANYPSNCQIKWDRVINLKSAQDTYAVDIYGNSYKTKCYFDFYIRAYNYDEVMNSYSPDEWNGHTPIFSNNNQSAGEDFYAYITAESGGHRYVECSEEAYGEPWPGGSNVQLSAKPEYAGQLLDPKKIWHFMRTPGSDYYIIRNEYSGWNLDVEGGIAGEGINICTWHGNHGSYPQRWIALNGGYNSAGGQLYNLATALNRPQGLYVMDVYCGTDAEGTNIQLYKSHGGVPQQFTITPISYSKSKPSAPANIRKIIGSDNTVRFEWDEVPRTGTYDSRQYEYVVSGGISGTEQVVIQDTTSSNSTREFTDFPLGEYRIEVKAVNTRYRDWCSDTAVDTGTIGRRASVSKWPSASDIFYGQMLEDSQLSGGIADVAGSFEWWDSTLIPKPGDNCDVLFIPDNTKNYWSCDSQVSITVNRTSPKVTSPDAGKLSLGEKLLASALSGGTAVNPYNDAIVAGSWKWCDSQQKPSESGTYTYQAVFIPDDAICYQNSEPVDVNVTVGEAEGAENPEEHTHIYNGGWKSDSDIHWKECECGNKSETAAHSFVWEDEGSSSRHEVCSICGYIGKAENNPGDGGDSDNDNIEVESVSFDKDTLTIRIGSCETLKAAVSPENATDKTIVWKSSNASVAEVSDSGIITAKSAGTAIITIESVSGKTASCQVTVEEAEEPENPGNEPENPEEPEKPEDSEKPENPAEPEEPESPEEPENPQNPQNPEQPEPSVPDPIMPDGGIENSTGQQRAENTVGYVEAVMWEPVTQEEKRRYECFGKEKVSYAVAEGNSYDIIIENEMQGPLCFNAFDAVLGGYTIGRTYNIFPYPDMIYKKEEEIRFTLRIPADIYKPDGKYRMICVTENGEVIIYDDLDNDSETITVRTNRFYAYALLYM